MRRIAVFALFSVLGACNGGGDPMMMPPPPDCEYPEGASGRLALEETMPYFRWEGAIGQDGLPFNLDLREFHCEAAYDSYRAMVLMVGAGWCAACPEYIAQLDGMSADLEANGTMLVYLEVETADFMPATSEDAREFIDGLIGADAGGVRAGDADNTVEDGVRGLVSRFPSGYFIRRRDMKIVADQAQSIYTIDYGALAADPEAEWTPQLPPFMPNCASTDEEALEPNDSAEAAAALPEGEVMGGICMPGSDFYRVDIAGPWRLDLYTDFFDGDLNLRLRTLEGDRIGGSSQRSNHDWIDYAGPALVEVYGEQNASTTYRMTLTAR